ncbi:MAG: DUF4838 domain-containing protein [Clostridia bacterium]|nr:DUF4838 domain-containing protein [Clostridia bacterium]
MKKKVFNSITALALCSVIASTSFSFAGTTSADVAKADMTGNHVRIISDTEQYIVQDGKTDYKVVVPENCSSIVTTAASELVTFFYEATGITLSVIDDTQATVSTESKYFSLGDTTLLRASSVYESVTYASLNTDGYRMVTEGNTVYMAGYGDYGTLYAVYDFLGDVFHYEFFYTDIYNLDTGVTDVKLRAYNIKERPDVAMRIYGWGYQLENVQTTNRQRIRSWGDYFIPVNGRNWHNTTSGYIPYDQYEAAHPKWYGDGVGKIQMCYTAHGDQAEYNALIEHLSETIVRLLEENPTKSVITITQEDSPYWCKCSWCAAEKEKYGSDSAAPLKLCNKVADRVGEIWRGKNNGQDRENGYDIVYFAYGSTIVPPTKNLDEVDEQGRLVMKSNEHTSAFFASTGIDSTQSLTAPVNAELIGYLEDWRKITDRFYWWTYHDNYRQYFVPYNGINTLSEYAKYIKEINTDLWFAQMEYNQSGTSTGWATLFGYLQTNLAWNVEGDVGAMTERFFKAVYKDGAAEMMALYEECRAWLQYMGDQGWYSGASSVFNESHKNEEYWPRHLLEGWLAHTQRAVESIAYLKDSAPKQYTNAYKAIATERVFIQYLLYDLHSADLNKKDLQNLKAQLKDDILLLGMSHLWELVPVQDFLSELSKN